MNEISQKIIIISIFATGVVGLSRFNCIRVKIAGLPDIMKNIDAAQNRWLFLYGGNICATCPTGMFIYKVACDSNVWFVFPPEYGQVDVENFRRAFSIKGHIQIADSRLDAFYVRLCRCLKKKKKNVE